MACGGWPRKKAIGSDNTRKRLVVPKSTRKVSIILGGSKDPVRAWVEGDHMERYQWWTKAGRTPLFIG